MHFADDEKKLSAAEDTSEMGDTKPNNVTIKLAAEESQPVQCGWGVVECRIVNHQGQGGMQMPGNVRNNHLNCRSCHSGHFA